MISFGTKLKFPVVSSIKIEDAYNMVKSGVFEKKINSIRDGNGEKKFLPFFSAPLFHKYIGKYRVYDGFATNRQFKIARYMIFDLDKVADVERTFDKITTIPSNILSFRSPSGNGIKMFCKIPIINNPHVFKYSYLEYLNYFRNEYGIDGFDEQTSDARRLCFVSSDKKAYFNDRASILPLVVPKLPQTKRIAEKPYIELPDDFIEVMKSGN